MLKNTGLSTFIHDEMNNVTYLNKEPGLPRVGDLVARSDRYKYVLVI